MAASRLRRLNSQTQGRSGSVTGNLLECEWYGIIGLDSALLVPEQSAKTTEGKGTGRSANMDACETPK